MEVDTVQKLIIIIVAPRDLSTNFLSSFNIVCQVYIFFYLLIILNCYEIFSTFLRNFFHNTQ